jgi:AcrR family transcriptional regulator
MAMVQLVGTRGYDAVSVEAVCEQARVEPALFERHFADKERCFLRLHAQIAAELCRLFRSAWQVPSSWHDRVWAAGWAAMRFLGADPARTRFLLVEVNGIGQAARAHRDETLRGLAELIDQGRDERGEPPRRVSLCSAEVAAGAIYRMILDRVEGGAVERGEDFLPELVYVAVMPYMGAAIAEQELQVEPLR